MKKLETYNLYVIDSIINLLHQLKKQINNKQVVLKLLEDLQLELINLKEIISKLEIEKEREKKQIWL